MFKFKNVLTLLMINSMIILLIFNKNQKESSDLVDNTVKLRDDNNCKEKRYPKALIIGPKKCGTGALLRFIGAHPEVVAKPSEVYFFDLFYNKSYEWYR
jgi:hypothetical protein